MVMESLTFQKRLLLSYLCHLSAILSVRSYNLDVSSAIVKKGPHGSYFGFSVARHIIFNTSIRAQTPIVLVTAASVNESEEISRRSAVLFACFISDSQTGEECQRIPIQTSEQSESLLMNVVSHGRTGGVVVACGRKTEKVTQAWMKDWCVSLTNDLKVLHYWDPCIERETSGAEDEMCLSGTNIFVDKRDLILIGAPGSHGGKEVLIGKSLFNVSELPLKRPPTEHGFMDKKSFLGMSVATSYKMLGSGATHMAGAPKSLGVGKVYLLQENGGRFHVEMELNGCQLGSNFGYKVTSADLNGDGLDELLVGAPTLFDSQSCGGAVYVYNNEELAKRSVKPSVILTNKFCKLEDSHFSSMTSSSFPKCHHDCHNSWFGSDIELLGDIDQDGFDDIVVGAPYEGDGAIYIFRGSKTGISIMPSQKISAASLFKAPVRSFGYSLSASHVDFDHNGFPDLVVGCYASDSVVLLRSRPVIDVHVELTSDLTDNKCKDEDCFVLNICLAYSVRLYKNMKDSSKLELELTLEGTNADDKIGVYFMTKVFSRISKDNETSSLRRDLKTKHFKKRIRLTAQGKPDCFQVPVYFTANNNSFIYDFSLRLTYKMISFTKLTPSLIYSSSTNFVYLHPVLSQDSLEPEERGVLHEVQLVRNCGNDNKCQSNLKVLGLMELPKDIHGTYLFKLNSMNEIKLFIQVGNLMEDAHNSRLFVYSPLPFKGSDKRHFCQPGNGLVTCELENPIRGEDEISLVLRFDVRQMNMTTESLNILLLVNTTSDEMDPDDNVDIIDVRIIVEVNLKILGLSIPSEIYYKKQNEGSNPRITHRYEIKNVGPNLAAGVVVSVDWPIGMVGEGGMLNLSIANIEVLGKGQCFIINKTIRAIKYKRNSHSINDFFKRYLSLPNAVRQTQKVDCYNSNSWKCVRVECIIEKLDPGHSFLMNIHSFVIQSDELIDKLFPETNVFDIKSISRINFINNSKLELVQTEDDKHWVTTSVLLANVLKHKRIIPNWMLVTSICFGMMTLLVIYSLFYKCGFFKRKRQKVMGSKIFPNIETERNAIIQVLGCPKLSRDIQEIEDKS